MQCYAIFTAVIASKNPARLPDLMAYMIIIAKASQKFAWPSWVVYDQNFRQEAACSTSTQWARVDPSIYTQCFTGMAIGAEGWCKVCQSIEHSSENCPLALGTHYYGWTARPNKHIPQERGADTHSGAPETRCTCNPAGLLHQVQPIQRGLQVWHSMSLSPYLQCVQGPPPGAEVRQEK